MDNNQCINYAAMLLTGPAQNWWNHLERTNQAPPQWEDMQNGLATRFQPVNEQRTAAERIYNLKQYTKVEDFIATFNDLTLKIPDMTDAEKFRLFMRGLKNEI
jgi:Retrotransposon gag protein